MDHFVLEAGGGMVHGSSLRFSGAQGKGTGGESRETMWGRERVLALWGDVALIDRLADQGLAAAGRLTLSSRAA